MRFRARGWAGASTSLKLLRLVNRSSRSSILRNAANANARSLCALSPLRSIQRSRDDISSNPSRSSRWSDMFTSSTLRPSTRAIHSESAVNSGKRSNSRIAWCCHSAIAHAVSCASSVASRIAPSGCRSRCRSQTKRAISPGGSLKRAPSRSTIARVRGRLPRRVCESVEWLIRSILANARRE